MDSGVFSMQACCCLSSSKPPQSSAKIYHNTSKPSHLAASSSRPFQPGVSASMDFCKVPSAATPLSNAVPWRATSSGAAAPTADESSITRRSANYPPSTWDYDFLQTLGDHTTVAEKHVLEAEKLKQEVRSMISGPMEPVAKLELIDVVQRLGLKYQFETEIKEALLAIYEDESEAWWLGNLHATALRFRLLRQARMFVPQDVFTRFKDEKNGKFMMNPCEEVKELLSLYEASFLGWEGEDILDEAKSFATMQLKKAKIVSSNLTKKVKHYLDLPLHWRAIRYEAKWFIDIYETEEYMNPALLKLSKLDFNIVQSVHHKEIGLLSRWWVNTRLDKMNFARNSLMQSYMYAVAALSDPQFSDVREMFTKIGSLITTIDDVYDVYGSLEELELFTTIVERWDIQKVDQLPKNIGMSLLAMFNTVNDLGYSMLKDRGFNGIPFLQNAWANQCRSYLKEAKWSCMSNKPPLEEYLNNALVSIGFPLLILACFLTTIEKPTKEIVDSISSQPQVRASSILSRLINDLGTGPVEMTRGDNLKTIWCYMYETNTSYEVAQERVEEMVHLWWKRLNKFMFESSPFPEPFLSFIVGSVRGSHFFYHHGDGFGNVESWSKNVGMSVLIHPILFD